MHRTALLSFFVLTAACGGSSAASSSPPPPVFVDDASSAPAISTVTVIEPDDLDASNEAPGPTDASVDGANDADEANDATDERPAFAAGEGGTCIGSLAPGALVIDELMIASVAGAGDDGEWIEVASTLDCAVDLAGLHGETPRGAQVATFDVTGDVWIPPRGRFVIADSSDPAINHYLPGLVIPWFGHLGDVLRNKGTSVTLTWSGALIDSVTYPALSITVGTSITFPSDCDLTARSDWSQWQRSTASWFPAFFGTPNGPNDDVHCLQ